MWRGEKYAPIGTRNLTPWSSSGLRHYSFKIYLICSTKVSLRPVHWCIYLILVCMGLKTFSRWKPGCRILKHSPAAICFMLPLPLGGTRCRSWLRHYTTSRKVANSIPYEVIGFFNWPDGSNSSVAPEFDSASNINQYQESSWGVMDGLPACKADSCLENLGASASHNPMGLHALLQE
jgi:hypothetical protein